MATGKKCTYEQLKQKFLPLIDKVPTNDFVAFFCRVNNFDQISYKPDIKVDYVLDLDTYLVFKPTYDSDPDHK